MSRPALTILVTVLLVCSAASGVAGATSMPVEGAATTADDSTTSPWGGVTTDNETDGEETSGARALSTEGNLTKTFERTVSESSEFSTFLRTEELPDGDIVAAGANEGNGTGLVARVGPDGDLRWVTHVEASNDVLLYHAVPTEDGGIIAAGFVRGSPAEGIVVKLSADGEVQWQRNYTNDRATRFHDIEATGDGRYVLVAQLGDFTSPDGWAVTIDGEGDVLTERTFSDTNLWGLVPLGGSEFVAVGGTNFDSGEDALAVRIDADGNVDWRNEFGTDGRDRLYDGYAMDGSAVLVGTVEEGSVSNSRIVGVDTSTGDEQWTRSINATGGSFELSIGIDEVGDRLVTSVTSFQGGAAYYEVASDGSIQELGRESNTTAYAVTATSSSEFVSGGSRIIDTDTRTTAAWIAGYSLDGTDDGTDDGTNETDGTDDPTAGVDADHVVHPSPVQVNLSGSGTATVQVVFTNATAGVGAFNFVNVTVGDTSVATVTDVSTTVAAGADTVLAADGSEGAVRVSFGGDTADTGTVTLLTVTLQAQDPGTTTLGVNLTGDVSKETGRLYTNVTAVDGTVTVRAGPPSLPGFESTPTNVDGDAQFEDVNGNSRFDIGDVQALFANRNTDAVQNNVDAFDFNNNGRVDIGDIQSLFVEYVNS